MLSKLGANLSLTHLFMSEAAKLAILCFVIFMYIFQMKNEGNVDQNPNHNSPLNII